MSIFVNEEMIDEIVGDEDDKFDDDIITFTTNVLVLRPVFVLGYLDGFTVQALEESDVAKLKQIVQLWDDLIPQTLVFHDRDDDADITINHAIAGINGGRTFSTLDVPLVADVSDVYLQQANFLAGASSWRVAVHELGHALGLSHPGDYDGTSADYNEDRDFAEDSSQFSIMSYFSPFLYWFTYASHRSDVNWDTDAIRTPMIYDILAIQKIYGADTSTRLGDTIYGFHSNAGNPAYEFKENQTGDGNAPVLTIWDAGGRDTLDLSGYSLAQRIDLHDGSYSDVGGAKENLGIAFNTFIEEVIGGSGKDDITGNQFDNVIEGRGGNDVIRGLEGNDTVVFSGNNKSSYTVTLLSNGAIQIVDNRDGSPDGTDIVSDVEVFKFADRTYNITEISNQPPSLSPDVGSPHPLTEFTGTTNSSAQQQVSGTLSFTDANAGDTHTASVSLNSATWSGAGAIPTQTLTALATAMSDSITADGTAGTLSWSFALADNLVDFVAVSETLTAVFDVTVADHHTGSSVSESSTAQVTIVFTGTNDVPVVDVAQSTLIGSTSELPNTTGSSTPDVTSGVIAFSDPDFSDRPSATIAAAGQTITWQDLTHDYTSELTAAQLAVLKASFTIAAGAGNTNTGTIDWVYSVADKELDFLSGGESLNIITSVVIDDQNGGIVSQNVAITINGVNDNPIAVPDSNGVAKGSTLSVSTANGLLANDSDPDIHDQDDLFVSAVGGSAANVGHAVVGTYGSLTLNADGGYVYTAKAGGLPAKIVAQDVFSYTLADGHGGTDTATLSIVVFNKGVSYQAGINTTLTGGNGPSVLDGSAGHDTLLGGNGPDVLIGGYGDTLTGGNGPDIFLFRPDFGPNTITDFNVKNDAMQFDASIFASVQDILSHTTDTIDGAVITGASGDSITLIGVTLAQLEAHQSDFYLA